MSVVNDMGSTDSTDHVFHGRRLAEDEVLESVEELLRVLVLPLEVVGVVNFLDVLLECGAVGPGLQGAVVHRLNGLN